jgi:hypothetical protein
LTTLGFADPPRQSKSRAASALFSSIEKWLDSDKSDEPILGTADIQSLADLGNSYAGVREMKIVPFGLRDITRLVAATAAPLLPLLLVIMPLEELVMRIIKIIF